MSASDEGIQRRPERVIVVDADDPMTEIHGRFVWQEEHDRVVDDVRRDAFAEGYAAGQRDAFSAQETPIQLVLRGRRTPLFKVKIAIFAIAALCLALTLPVLVLAN